MTEEVTTPDTENEDVEAHALPPQVGTMLGNSFDRSLPTTRSARRSGRKARRRGESRTAPTTPIHEA